MAVDKLTSTSGSRSLPQNKVKQEIAQASKIVEKERQVLGRIPMFLPLLASFGLVSTFYGFEKILDQTPLVDQPLWLLLLGVVLLIITGASAKKL